MNLHAALVHFPVALLLCAPVVDGVGLWLRKPAVAWTGVALLGVALLSSVFATATGQIEYDAAYAQGFTVEQLDRHASYASLVPWLVLTVLGLRVWLPSQVRLGAPMAVLLGLLVAVFVLWVGHTGGHLVYEMGVGVKAGAR